MALPLEMFVYRIARRAYIDDLTGLGARLYGGRWNHQGTAMVYASESRSLATLEYLVHLPPAFVPTDLAIATLEIPDDIPAEDLTIDGMPEDWRRFPAPLRCADLGASWIRSRQTLLLRVPSAIVEEEFNVLINPEHPHMSSVTIRNVEPYAFDDRLMK
jgi:RES domain-containing protein